jgi:hypothetical protein
MNEDTYFAFAFDFPPREEKRWGICSFYGFHWSDECITEERLEILSDKGIVERRYQGPSEEDARESLSNVVISSLTFELRKTLRELP